MIKKNKRIFTNISIIDISKHTLCDVVTIKNKFVRFTEIKTQFTRY